MTSQTEPVMSNVDTEAATAPPAFDLNALTPTPLQFPPAIRTPDDEVRAQEWAAAQAEAAAPKGCLCGKNPDNPDAHGGMTCEEVLDIEARVRFSGLTRWQQFRARRRGEEPSGWRLPLTQIYGAINGLDARTRERNARDAHAREQKEREALRARVGAQKEAGASE